MSELLILFLVLTGACLRADGAAIEASAIVRSAQCAAASGARQDAMHRWAQEAARPWVQGGPHAQTPGNAAAIIIQGYCAYNTETKVLAECIQRPRGASTIEAGRIALLVWDGDIDALDQWRAGKQRDRWYGAIGAGLAFAFAAAAWRGISAVWSRARASHKT